MRVLLRRPPAGQIALLWSDLSSGPNTDTAIETGTEGVPTGYSDGCFVTLIGKGFGATRGSGKVELNGAEVASYTVWGENNCAAGRWDVIVVQLGSAVSTGNFVVTNDAGQQSNGIPFTVDNSRVIREVDSDAVLDTAMTEILPANDGNQSDIVYLRTGTYGDQHGATGWGDAVIGLGGSKFNDTAWIGYPGETATIDDSGTANGEVRLDDGDGTSRRVTVSNLRIDSSSWCIRCAGNFDRVDGSRFVNNDCSTTSTFLASGPINPSGPDILVAANYCHDMFTGGAVNNMNHVIYMQESNDGPDIPTTDSEVGGNTIYNIRTGGVIQWHTDNAAQAWTGNVCRWNLVQQGPDGTCRGLTHGEQGAGSELDVYCNVFDVDGQDFIGIMYSANERFDPGPSHTCNFYNNTVIMRTAGNTKACIGNYFNENTVGVIKNNIIWDASGAEEYFDLDSGDVSITQWDIDANCYFDSGNGPTEDSNALNDDPELDDPSNVTWLSRDYSLGASSPCIGAGTSDTLPATPPFDFYGNPWPTGNADIGHDQRQAA